MIRAGRFDLTLAQTWARFAARDELLGALLHASRSDAIGAAVAFLLQAAEDDPGQLRAVLSRPADGEGTARIVDVLTRAGR